MSEKPDWFHVKRESPTIEIEVQGETWRMDYWNTWIYVFDKYPEVSYLHHVDESGSDCFMFNALLVVDHLREKGFPTYYEPYPSDDEIEMYVEWFSQENGL